MVTIMPKDRPDERWGTATGMWTRFKQNVEHALTSPSKKEDATPATPARSLTASPPARAPDTKNNLIDKIVDLMNRQGGAEGKLAKELTKLKFDIHNPITYLQAYVENSNNLFRKGKHLGHVQEAMGALGINPSAADCLRALDAVAENKGISSSGVGTYDAMHWALEVKDLFDSQQRSSNLANDFAQFTGYQNPVEFEQARSQAVMQKFRGQVEKERELAKAPETDQQTQENLEKSDVTKGPRG